MSGRTMYMILFYNMHFHKTEDNIAKAIKELPSKNILLIGDSGNIPSIIKKMTGKRIKPISEEEYDNLYILAEH